MNKITFLIMCVSIFFSNFSLGQTKDSINNVCQISGSVIVTNNGISIVPSFSLGKPAAILILSVAKSRFSFEPDLRFSLAGKPWSFLFWGKYKIVNNSRFKMNAGTHLGLNFRTSVLPINRDTSEATVVRRYLATELFPRYYLSKNISTGIYYLYSHGLDAGTIKNTHFITFNTNFSNIKITQIFFLKFNPQLYYLKLDKQDGFYFTSTLTLAPKDFPVTIQSTINKTIRTNITGNKNFLWNVSVSYTFNKNYMKI